LTDSLAVIPVVDVREGGPLRHAREASDRARGLRDACLAWFPAVVPVTLPLLDGIARRWLMRSQSPYVEEVRAVAASLSFPGIWFLNGSYQWSCTALAREDDGGPWLVRTLDWPFPGLGRFLEVARMSGPAGDFDNIAWPGYVGSLTAYAPGRFAASLNQAPMRRRTLRPWLRPYDMLLNARRTWHIRSIPPDHLLRQVFENCRSFAEARNRLETVPVARPVIYTLIGCAPGEYCVIERTEDAHRTRYEHACAANDWRVGDPRYEARLGARLSLTASYDEAAANSRRRCDALANWQGDFSRHSFAWLMPPVLNGYTRAAVEMCPAKALLRVIGYEASPTAPFAEPATQRRELIMEQVAA